MRQNTASTLPAAIKQCEIPAVLSEFQIDNHQFLVIRLENNSETQFSLDNPADPSKTYTEVDRFRVQDQICAIVKVEQAAAVEIDLVALLTQRELQIAALVAAGQGNKQVANHLRISEWTVSTHLRRIFIKLGVDSRAAMVYRCAPMIQKLFRQVDHRQ